MAVFGVLDRRRFRGCRGSGGRVVAGCLSVVDDGWMRCGLFWPGGVTEVAAVWGVAAERARVDGPVSDRGLAGLADRSHRLRSSPSGAASVDVRVAELRRAHPRWGANGSGWRC